MTSFGILYLSIVLGALAIAFSLGTILYNGLYRYCPAFRHSVNRFYDSLPMNKWRDGK